MVAQVNDESGTTTFTLFNKEAEQLIGVPLEKIFSELAPVNTMVALLITQPNIFSTF